jgi:hypothetical protein
MNKLAITTHAAVRMAQRGLNLKGLRTNRFDRD